MSKDIEQKAITITIEPPHGEPAASNWAVEIGIGVVVAVIAAVVIGWLKRKHSPHRSNSCRPTVGSSP